MSDTIVLTFAVPTEVAITFQSQAQHLLDQLLSGRPKTVESDGFVPLPSSEARMLDIWKQPPWTDRDAERIEWAVGDTPMGPLQVLTVLIDNAGRFVTGQQIATACGLKGAKSVPPSFKSLAARCRRTERHPMWDYDQQQGYVMDTEVAAMFAPYVRARLAS